MNKNPQHYVSYLLRLWKVDGESGPVWRASLQSPQTAERINFADLQALINYLTDTTAELSRQSAKDDNAHEVPGGKT